MSDLAGEDEVNAEPLSDDHEDDPTSSAQLKTTMATPKVAQSQAGPSGTQHPATYTCVLFLLLI